MRLNNVCIALCLSSATAFVPLSQPKRTFVSSTNNFAPRTITSLYGKKKKNEDVAVALVDRAAEQAGTKLEVGGEEKVEVSSSVEEQAAPEEQEEGKEIDPQLLIDEERMGKVIDMVQAAGGEHGASSAYPNPTCGAMLVGADGRILGQGRSDYNTDCVHAVMENAGLEVTPLREWCVTWPNSKKLRKDLSGATLYLTLEPTDQRKGQAVPPITELIQLSGVGRVVIGCPNPIPELASKGASALHMYGIETTMGSVLQEECEGLISDYTSKATSKLQRMARNHFKQFKKPLGFMHCSVVDSDDLEAYARHGNAFGKNFGGKELSYRNLGAYEIAPPPETIWADDQMPDDFDLADDVGNIFDLDFEDENYQEALEGTPMMPWYEQVDAVVATFPKPGDGPVDDDSIQVRLNGLKWLATYGGNLPAGVERILVMDATDLEDLPLTNDHPMLPPGVDVETFWAGVGRKPTRVLLRRGASAQAQAAAKAAAEAAQAAANAAQRAMEAIETGDSESAAEAAIECQQAAASAAEISQKELMYALELKRKLTSLGTVVETLSGGDPIDVMKHLGDRNGYHSVVWRAGCWGNMGVKAIAAGAFQWVSAHLAVDAKGGKFWQLMLAERAVQAACGPESKVKVFAAAEDISLEYCDQPEADSDCTLTVSGRPVRHVRLDCRVALVDADRPREFVLAKTKILDRKIIKESAPWFL